MANQPLFYLQIVDRDGVVATLPGGGALEADLVELMTVHIMQREVGLFRTKARVEAEVRAGLASAIMAMKKQTRALVGSL